jgi:hypothetical protein
MKRATREQVSAFDEARRALEENGERERKAGIREETEPYHLLNSRVVETEQPLSPWQRSYLASDLRGVRDEWRQRRAVRRSR